MNESGASSRRSTAHDDEDHDGEATRASRRETEKHGEESDQDQPAGEEEVEDGTQEESAGEGDEDNQGQDGGQDGDQNQDQDEHQGDGKGREALPEDAHEERQAEPGQGRPTRAEPAIPHPAPRATSLLPSIQATEKITSFMDFAGGLDLSLSMEADSVAEAPSGRASGRAPPPQRTSPSPPRPLRTSAAQMATGPMTATTTLVEQASRALQASSQLSPARSAASVSTSGSRIPRRAPGGARHAGVSVGVGATSSTQTLQTPALQRVYVLEARCRALEEQVRLAQARAEAATAGQTQMDDLPTLKALREQDALLAATQASNAQLQHELRALQAGDKLAYAQMQAERDRLSAEAFRLRSQVEALEAQLSGAGALSSDRAAGLENQLEAARAALAETKREREAEDKRWRQECEALREALETADARAEGRSARELARLREERTEAFEAAAAARRLAQRAEEERDALMAALEAGEHQVQASTADTSDIRTQALSRRAAEPGSGSEKGSPERPRRQRETMASLLQPDDEDSVVILRGKLARATEERARLQAELHEAREAAEQQLAELHDAFSAHRERAAERETELEKALTAARRERSLRPHTRVRDLERELAAVLRRQQTGASTDASARVADVDQAEALLQRLSAEHARTTAERDQLRAEKQQQAEAQEKLRGHCEELREVRDKLQADHAAAVSDLQQRVDAALALSEKHRTGKDAARSEASRLSAELERLRGEHARQVQRLEDALARRGAAEGTIQGLQLLVERLQDALKRAPSPDALVEAERHRHRAEQECSRLKAALHVAQQYHTPTMQHFTLLQAKVEQLEDSAARRELQMKAVVAQRDRAAALAKEEADETWRRRMMKKVGSWGTDDGTMCMWIKGEGVFGNLCLNLVDPTDQGKELSHMRQQLDELLGVLQIMQQEGIRLPSAVVSSLARAAASG